VNIADNTIYFQQAGDLWRSDGTTAGTKKLLSDRSLENSIALGNVLLFSSFNRSAVTHELWRTDGTAAGTKRVSAVNIQSDFIDYKGAVYFMADDGAGGQALWKTDGTSGGTKLLKSIVRPAATNPFAIAGNTLYFIAADVTLWKSDGTAAGTKIVKQIPSPSVPGASNVYFIAAAGNRVFFDARDTNHGLEPWTSDGTSTGTTLLKDINPGKEDSLAFSMPSEEDDILVTTDSAPAGNTLYFAANDGTHGIELWKSDGTSSGTKLVQDIDPGVDGSWPQAFAVQGNKLLFSAADELHGRELWQLPLA
jgi:ELWxxDGT repeat protein